MLDFRTQSFRKFAENAAKTTKTETTRLPMLQAFHHSSPRSLLIFRQKLNKDNETRKIFEILSFPMLIPDSFRLKNCIYLFSKHTGQHIFPC